MKRRERRKYMTYLFSKDIFTMSHVGTRKEKINYKWVLQHAPSTKIAK